MDFTLNINMDNAAFEDNAEHELARILESLVDILGYGYTEGKVHDVNGNRVGSWEITG